MLKLDCIRGFSTIFSFQSLEWSFLDRFQDDPLSRAEWFDVPKSKVKIFLKGIDQYLYNQVVPPPMWGTKFTATSATKITVPRQVAPGVGVYYLGKDPKKRGTFRNKSKSKHARSLASEKALVLSKKGDAERKKQLAADKKDAKGSVS